MVRVAAIFFPPAYLTVLYFGSCTLLYCTELDYIKLLLNVTISPSLLLPADSSLRDGLYHEYKKHGKALGVTVFGQGSDRYAVVSFKNPDDARNARQATRDMQFFGSRIAVELHEGQG